MRQSKRLSQPNGCLLAHAQAGNRLSELSATLFDCTQLRSLNVSFNQLTQLSPGVERLTGLQELVLSGNTLGLLPAAVCRLTQLTSLAVDRNRLPTLPSAISSLTSLRRLVRFGFVLMSAAYSKLHVLPTLPLAG